MRAFIKNYTSAVAIEQTIARIEQRLSAIGANSITKHYDSNHRVAALLFVVDLGDQHYTIRLPANADACFEALWKDYRQKARRIHSSAEQRIRDQAARTAWKIIQDWVDVQISLITMKQADWIQVFMSYIWDGERQQTVYDLVRAGGFKSLPAATPLKQLAAPRCKEIEV